MNANFEQFAREQLSGHEVQVDAEALWGEIYPHVKPENNKRRFFWLFLLGLFVSLAGLGVYYTSNSNPSDINDITVKEANNTPHKNQVVKKTQAIIPQASNTERSQTIIKSETNLPTSYNATKEVLSKQNQSTVKANTASTKGLKQSGSKASVSRDIPSLLTDQLAQTDKSSSTPKVITNDLDNNVSSLSAVSIFNAVSLLEEGSIKPLEFDFNTDLDIPSDFRSDLNQSVEAYKKQLKKQNKKPSPRNNFFRGTRVGLGLYTGISQSSSNLDAKTENADAFVLARTVAEKQLETLHFGLNAIVQTESNLYLRTGVEYTRIGSLFSRSATSVTMDTTQGIVEYQINGITGDTINIIMGDVITTKTINYNKKSYNYFHLIDVPIVLGYNFKDSEDAWVIGVEGGVYANVFVKNKGEIPLDNGSFYDIGDDPNNWYKTNVGISPFVGINAAYKFSENFQIHVSPSFRFSSVYSTDANPLKEEHGNLGVLAGVRYFFD